MKDTDRITVGLPRCPWSVWACGALQSNSPPSLELFVSDAAKSVSHGSVPPSSSSAAKHSPVTASNNDQWQ